MGLFVQRGPSRQISTGPNVHTVAHEKIVADLGYVLGFAVAPAMLSRLTTEKLHAGQPLRLPSVVALSFDILEQPRSWSGVCCNLTDAHKAALAPQIAAVFALHCWIDDHDHSWNEGNARFEINGDGSARAVFYDYAWSLSHEWTPPAASPTRDWTKRDGPYALAQDLHLAEAIEHIERLAVKELRDIIRRVPVECFPSDLGVAFVDALDLWRTRLRKLLTGAP